MSTDKFNPILPFGQLSNNDIMDRNIKEQSTFDMDRGQDPLLNVDPDVNILYLQSGVTNMSIYRNVTH